MKTKECHDIPVRLCFECLIKCYDRSDHAAGTYHTDDPSFYTPRCPDKLITARKTHDRTCSTSSMLMSCKPPFSGLYTSVPLMITVCAGKLTPHAKVAVHTRTCPCEQKKRKTRLGVNPGEGGAGRYSKCCLP